MEIPLRNKHKEIIAYTIVSKDHYEHLSQIKWYKDKKYVKSTIKGKNWYLHRYIMIKILGNELIHNQLIDHINNNPLDNTIDNLRIVNFSENARNIKKKDDTTSKYMGVFLSKDKNKWNAAIRINNERIRAEYEKEIHAGWQYNLWIDKFNLNTETKNDIKEPEDFILYKSRDKKENLPKGIDYYKNKFRVRIVIDKKEKHIGIFDSLEHAKNARQKAEKERDIYQQNKLLSIPKTYNEYGNCIFKIKDNEIIIDEESYYDIIKYHWQIRNNGYIQGTINGKSIILSRYIINYNGDNYVDHINNNKLDYRKNNLRIVTPKQNMMNKSSSKNSSSKYIGVYFDQKSKKYQSYINVDGKKINLGYFVNEIDAAKTRDLATTKYFGEYGNLNFPDIIEN